MKRNTCLAAALLLTGLGTTLSAIPAEAAATGSMPLTIQSASKSQLTPAVQKTLDRLFTMEPKLKKLQLKNCSTSDQTGITTIRMLEGEDPTPLSSAYIDIRSKTGELRSFSFQFHDRSSSLEPSASFAKEQAQKFLFNWFGSKQLSQFGTPVSNGRGSSSIQYPDGTKSTWAHRTVEFPLLINGIPTSTGGVGPRMDVDATGHVVRFEYNPPSLSQAVLPDPKDALKTDTLKKHLFTPERVSLSYVEQQPSYTQGKNGIKTIQPVLRYDMNLPVAVNAFTGKAVDLVTGDVQNESENRFEPWKQISLAPAEQKLHASSQEEAAHVLLNVCGVDVSGWKVDEQEQKIVHPQYVNTAVAYTWWNDDTNAAANVMIDKVTKQILHVDVTKTGQEDQMVTKEEAFEKAAQFIQTYVSTTADSMKVYYFHSSEKETLPFWADKTKIQTFVQENQMGEYEFRFTEQKDGIPIRDRSSFVTVNTAGEITSFSLSPERPAPSLPPASSLASRADVARTFSQNTKLMLEYMWPDYFGQRAPSPVLVYRITGPIPGDSYVDARTGTYTTVPFESDNY
ncbi:hypothetical protein DFP93_11377 [Aneurinibacillus soli]|uniref:Uncharacterized protein n=1 Tax=Aneurinibacillus soli TaxID=1500254 RepID=A0A0U5AU14_9BACL|nr:YcdB/YcdC domain-containing protein [Aneurinibacillus soli]PYE60367.1 hypothetical protein DFP93_11377 [Aneurinibacillus soli]BAU27233.1 hypothetical protein CB4_01402 [Aneurinibacillus soli]